MNTNDDSAALIERVSDAAARNTALRIEGGNSKQHLGNRTDNKIDSKTAADVPVLSLRKHTGVISYEPTELVVSVRAGTALSDLNQCLSDAGQMLPFEPPVFLNSTIGGVLACALSGPRRPFTGSARDYVLGTRIINGQGQDLSFGGEVMKNVAGYDVSRVQVGAWGTLGVLLDVSMKVLPKPDVEITLQSDLPAEGMASFAALMRQPLPLSGAMLIDGQRYVRLSGSESAVRAAAQQLGGEEIALGEQLWRTVRDHTHEYFDNARSQIAAQQDYTLWRVSVADHTPTIELPGDWLYEWAGAQRWLLTNVAPSTVFQAATAAGGHAMRYSPGPVGQPAFQPLNGALLRLQARLRDSFDPQRLFNPGRFHPEMDTLGHANGNTTAAVGA